jgi:hypothetical protein
MSVWLIIIIVAMIGGLLYRLKSIHIDFNGTDKDLPLPLQTKKPPKKRLQK